MKTRKYPMPTMADTSKYSNMNEHDVVALYNEHVNEYKNVTDDESASKYVDVMLPIICRLGELRVGCPCKGRMSNYVMSAKYFTDCRTRKIASLNKCVAAAFKKHGWCTSVRCSPISINEFLGKENNVSDDDVKITSIDTPAPAPVASAPAQENIFDGLEIIADENGNVIDIVDKTTETSPVVLAPSKKTTKKTTKNVAVASVPAPVATTTKDDKYIAPASVSTSNDEVNNEVVENDDMYNESALYDVLGGYEVVDEQVADVAVENNNESSDNVPSASNNETSAWAPVTDDDMALAIESRLSACETIDNNMDTRLAKLRQYKEKRLASESVWTRLRHFFFGFSDNEMTTMHAACA